MKDKNEDLAAILAKAERFFERANYPLAKIEFEKAAKIINRTDSHGIPDFMEKLKLCRQEIDLQKAKELTKKAKRLLEKNNSAEALRCYEQALALHYDARLAEKIEAMRSDRSGLDSAKEAKDVELTGNYGQAAQLYGQAFAAKNDPSLLAGQARCLVKAGDYQAAIAILEFLDPAAPAVCYDHGFALIQQGRYFAGLTLWEGLRSQDARFRTQQATAQALLAADLFERWGRKEALADIYEEGCYLLANQERGDIPPDLEKVVEHCRYAKLIELWQQGRFGAIATLLMPFSPAMPPPLCTFAAKVFFKLAEESSRYLSELTLFWLTALFAPQPASLLADNDEGQHRMREELIRRAESLITRLAESGDQLAQKELSAWAMDCRVVEELQRLVKGRQHLAPLVCTPRFARCFGQGDEVLALIRESRELFATGEQYLETGCLFTELAESLYLLAAGDYEQAMTKLPTKGQGEDFDRYAILKVNFVCGVHHLEMKRSKPWRFFTGASTLFAMAPRYEEELCAKAMLASNQRVLEGYETVLATLYRERPSPRIAEALSHVMTEHAFTMAHGNTGNWKSLEAILRKALLINPDNELAHIALGDVRDSLAIEEMQGAIGYHTMAKAFRIVQDSASDRVREYYFKSMEQLFEQLDEESSISLEQRVFFIQELRDWCVKMDDCHPLLNQIDASLRHLTD